MSSENVELIKAGAPLLRRLLDGEDVPNEEFTILHPDVEITALTGSYRGVDGFKEWVRELRATFGNLPWLAQDFVDAGDLGVLVISTARVEGTHRGTEYEHELPNLYTVRDGRIVRVRSFASRTEALAAVGQR
ncbi:MAG TPA: nuclear transport factor 2 family protein [Thermoleophilaceae bacterium]